MCGDVEEQHVLAGDDVGDSVAVLRRGPEPSTPADKTRVFLQVHLVSLAVRRLRSGQGPGCAQRFLSSRQVFVSRQNN